MSKPRGYLTSTARDPGAPSLPTVVELLQERGLCTLSLMPVGRLDVESEGLLLLTCDGHLCRRMLHPSRMCAKTYLAVARGHSRSSTWDGHRLHHDRLRCTPELCAKVVEEGVVLHAKSVAPYTTRPVKMELLSYQEAKALLGGGDALQGCLAGVIAGGSATRKCKLGKWSEESQLPERGHKDEPVLPVSASGSTVAAEEVAEAQSLDFISVTLTRGRFHEIRLLLRAIGFETLRLIRLTCGPLSDPRLLASPGAWREIEGEELERLVEYSLAHRCEHKASDEAEVFADDSIAARMINVDALVDEAPIEAATPVQ